MHGTERGARHDGLGERHGLKLVYTADVLANVSGGVRRTAEYLGNVDLKSTVDADRLLGWQDTIFFVYLLNNHGGEPSEHAGAAQAVSNIEAPSTTKLFEAWVQKSLYQERLSFLAGLYDLNSEFYVTESSELFLNDSFGTGKDLNQTGRNGPSIFPTTSVGMRVKAEPMPSLYLQAVALDGVPGDPDNPRGTRIRFAEGDGALIVAEVGYLADGKSERSSKYALGTWRYTARFDDLLYVDSEGLPRQRTDRGVYFLAEHGMYREADAAEQGLDVFLRYGRANSDVNRFAHALGAGAVYTGLVPGRPQDQLGLSLAKARNGGKYQRLQRLAGAPVTEAETVFELTYRAQVRPWLAVQPDVQYVVDPGTDPTLKNAWVVGVRVEMSFEHDAHPW
ncbi:carbohydrate porin [Sulfurifustis variabilis]|uniref:carbohydrate porin n=1 Tax=Sulfurifustis variabilis TaxID=1675686 RepID=UPI001473267E|nr:carbohydrate porin [Sulfurifustis variabilis]